MLDIDFRFCETEYELSALGEYIDTLERQFPDIEGREQARLTSFLHEAAGDEAEIQIAFQQIHDLTKHILPRFLRGPVLVSLWSIYQAAAEEVAEYIFQQKGLKVRMKDLNGSGELDKLEKYFSLVLEYPLYGSDVVKERLELLNATRNSVAHGNGRISLIKPDRLKLIEKHLDLGIVRSPSNDAYLFEARFIQSTYQIVAGSLQDLMVRVRAEF